MKSFELKKGQFIPATSILHMKFDGSGPYRTLVVTLINSAFFNLSPDQDDLVIVNDLLTYFEQSTIKKIEPKLKGKL